MSHAFVFWINENMGDIIPVRDIKLTPQQKKIQEEAGGLGHVVGSIVKARYREEYYDAKVLQIGSSKELSEAEENLFQAEIKERKEQEKNNKKRTSRPPNRYSAGNMNKLPDSEDETDEKAEMLSMNNKRRWNHAKEIQHKKLQNQDSTFLNIITKYEENVNLDHELTSENSGLTTEMTTSHMLAEANKVLNDEVVHYSLINQMNNEEDNIIDMNNQNENKENEAPEQLDHQLDNYDNYSKIELIDEIKRLRSRIEDLETQGCPKCAKQKPPPQVRAYFKLLMNDEELSPETVTDSQQPVTDCSSPAIDKVPVIDGYEVFITKSQKITLLVEGKKSPQNMVAKFLGIFYTTKDLATMSYNGLKLSSGLPDHLKDLIL